jgi:flagellar motor protein MotB
MRIPLLFLLALAFSSCISNKIHEGIVQEFQAELSARDRALNRQQDSLLTTRLALERSLGGNDMLLITQDRLQDRLMVLEDELDQLRGNLTSTNFQMSNQLAELRQEKREVELTYDSLRMRQDGIIDRFQQGVDNAVRVIRSSVEGMVPDDSYALTTSAGEVTLSVQEDLLFKNRTSDQINDGAATILRAVMDALQADPLLKLSVVGHTDNQPNPRRNFNNWQYAARRATAIAEELAETYYLSPNRVVAASHGEFRPVQSNASPEGQRANRRLDFVLRNNVGNLVRELNKLGESGK